MTIDDGTKFEYRLKRLFYYMGYLTRRGVTLTPIFDSGEIKIADVDVLGIKFLEGFKPYQVIGECKSGKNVGTVDRLLWMRGLREYLKADETFVAKSTFTQNTNELARNWGILALDEQRIEELENAWLPDNRLWVGSHNYPVFFEKQKQLYDTVIKKDPKLRLIFLFTKSTFWYMENNIRLKRTITYIDDLAGEISGDWEKNDIAYIQRWLILELIVLFSIGLLYFCFQCYSFSKNGRNTYAQQLLVAGLLPYEEVKKLREAAQRYIYQKVKELTGQVPLFSDEASVIPPPEYSVALIDNVERLITREGDSLYIPRFLDMLVYDIGLKGGKIEKNNIERVCKGNTEMIYKLSKNILFFLTDQTRLKQDQISELINWEIPQ